jgi:hypothetical protein
MADPLLGWIAPQDRTQDQQDAHAKAMAMLPRFLMAPVVTGGPFKVMLTDFWKKLEVIADIGFEFTGFRQLTGSCVGVSDGNCVLALSAIQRMIADAPTKAFLPFWGFSYGRTRYLEGDRGQGEGAVDSVMGTQNVKEGILEATVPGLPTFDRSDGLALTKKQELQWSDGGSALVTGFASQAKVHLMGTRSPLYSVQDIKTAVLNGYPVLDGCNNFVGSGSIKSTQGNPAYARGHYDGRGGHSTCILGYWDHPNDGPLYMYSNQWDGSTYPTDPAGAGRCCVWIPESEMTKLFSTGGGDGETMALSHMAAFPVQVDRILNLLDA